MDPKVMSAYQSLSALKKEVDAAYNTLHKAVDSMNQAYELLKVEEMVSSNPLDVVAHMPAAVSSTSDISVPTGDTTVEFALWKKDSPASYNFSGSCTVKDDEGNKLARFRLFLRKSSGNGGVQFHGNILNEQDRVGSVFIKSDGEISGYFGSEEKGSNRVQFSGALEAVPNRSGNQPHLRANCKGNSNFVAFMALLQQNSSETGMGILTSSGSPADPVVSSTPKSPLDMLSASNVSQELLGNDLPMDELSSLLD